MSELNNIISDQQNTTPEPEVKPKLNEYQIDQLYRLRDALDDLDRRVNMSKWERFWRKLIRKY